MSDIDRKGQLLVIKGEEQTSETGLPSTKIGVKDEIGNILTTNLLFSSAEEFYELQFNKLKEIANFDDFKSFITGYYRKAGANDKLIGLIFERFININGQDFPNIFIQTMKDIVFKGSMVSADKIFDNINLRQTISVIQQGGKIDESKVFFLGLGKSPIIAYYYHLLAKIFVGK